MALDGCGHRQGPQGEDRAEAWSEAKEGQTMTDRLLPVSVVVSVGFAIQPASVRNHAEYNLCKPHEYKRFAH